tara:strand:+ start:540 stop:908 length:369 start_codon:yes stop_codon:yes gene_type:complete
MSDKCNCDCGCGEKYNGLMRAEGFALETLVEYGEGAVVSRTLMEESGGTVTAFAFDEGQCLSEHSAPYDAMVQVLDGKAEFVVDGVAHQLEAGQVLIMPANIPHAVRSITRFKMLLTMIKKG